MCQPFFVHPRTSIGFAEPEQKPDFRQKNRIAALQNKIGASLADILESALIIILLLILISGKKD
jgi:hypothetical protein